MHNQQCFQFVNLNSHLTNGKRFSLDFTKTFLYNSYILECAISNTSFRMRYNPKECRINKYKFSKSSYQDNSNSFGFHVKKQTLLVWIMFGYLPSISNVTSLISNATLKLFNISKNSRKQNLFHRNSKTDRSSIF